ncbi:MAG: hypothetical protein EZS28_045866 [Streblomastix strix]|uniref:Uncharacterized protein n=1 Tax=Streblomastix strix TaxID=222440 RepID=A0A5J4TK00_9EUKA|nr:MAG: hypothetical protein EZS28_045866 [Streblomastix strix]
MKVKLRATYINSPKFQPDIVENVSNAAKSLYSYSHVAKEVEFKRTKVKESMEKLELMQQALAKKKFELRGLKKGMLIQKLNMMHHVEYGRWTQTVKDLTASRSTLPGDALIATGYVTYLGPFTSEHRKQLSTQ